MKKVLAMLLTFTMLFALMSCGKTPQTTPTDSNNPSITEAPKITDTTTEAAKIPETTLTPDAQKTSAIDTIIVGVNAEIVTANRSEYNFDVISGTLSQLAPVFVDEDGNFQPLLCDYNTTDSLLWTLTIRDGMTWHDGTPVTAEDIQFTLEYLDTQTDGGYANSYSAIRVLDDKSIELKLAAPNPRHLSNLTTLRIMPKHIYEGIDDYTTVSNEQANIGCGPYQFKRFDPNASVVEFAAVKNYPDGQPAADTIILKLFDSSDTMYMALKAGEIDLVYKYSGGVDAAVISDLESSGSLTLMPIKNTANSACLIFNNNAVPGNDINIRKAIASAIDYDKFRELFGTPYSVPANVGFIPDGSYGYIETDVLQRNLENAKEYLAVDCIDSDNDGYVEYKGKKLSLSIMLRDDKPEHARYAELLMNNLKEVGIEVVLDIQEVANFRAKTEQEKSQFAIITGLTAFGMAKNQGLASLYLWGENAMAYGQVYDKAYKTLLNKADAAASLEDYKIVATEIQQYYAENIPAIALFWDSHVQAFSNRLDGFVVDGTFGIMNIQSWMKLTKKQA